MSEIMEEDVEQEVLRCRFCLQPMTDLTNGYGPDRNYYCRDNSSCKAHYWKGKWYTEKEWERWINAVDR